MTHAVITGAGSGIGAAISRALAAAGFRISLFGRTEQTLNAVAATLTVSQVSSCIRCDVSSEASTQTAFARAVEENGEVDVLVNCAGTAPTAPFHKLDFAAWQQVLDVNLNGVFHCTSAVIGAMRAAHKGRIVNIASTASLQGYPYVSAYTAAKHGVLGLTRALALENAALGITVNAICPGYTDTDIVRDAIANIMKKTGRSEEQALAHFTSSNPQGRLVDPTEIADTVVWLCSDSARSVNGQAIALCGGETA